MAVAAEDSAAFFRAKAMVAATDRRLVGRFCIGGGWAELDDWDFLDTTEAVDVEAADFDFNTTDDVPEVELTRGRFNDIGGGGGFRAAEPRLAGRFRVVLLLLDVPLFI